MKEKLGIKDTVVFFDFDNTISTFDILDDMLERFSRSAEWMKIEEQWKRGEIGSRECLKAQIEGISITKKELDKYLSTIKLDPSFKKLVEFLKKKNIKTFIVSDNFDYILNKILKDNGISGLEVYSNSIRISGDNLVPGFPLTNKACGDCAHCKKTTVNKKAGTKSTAVYVGDGKSDLCGSQAADIVFAKDYLREYYTEKKLPHIPFDNLEEVYDYLQERIR